MSHGSILTGLQPPRLKRLTFLVLTVLAMGVLGVCLLFPSIRSKYLFRTAEKSRQRRDFTGARRDLARNLSTNPNSSRDHYLLARVARQTGAFDEAGDELKECERLEGPTERIGLERALLQVQQGQLTPINEKQLQIYVARDHPESLQILEALTVGCLTSYRFASAHGYLSEWIDRNSADFQAYIWRSLADEHIKEYVAARDDARQAVALAPSSFEARLRLGQALLLTTEFQEAYKIYEALYVENSDKPQVAMGMAQASAKLGKMDEAASVLDRLAARFPDDATVLLEQGRLLLQMGELKKAEEILSRGSKAAPWDYQVNYTFTQCLRQQGKDTTQLDKRLDEIRAEQSRLHTLNQRLGQNPYDLAIRCDIARIYLSEGNAKEAISWLKSALKMDPHFSLANELLADHYEKSGQPALAAPYRAALTMGQP